MNVMRVFLYLCIGYQIHGMEEDALIKELGEFVSISLNSDRQKFSEQYPKRWYRRRETLEDSIILKKFLDAVTLKKSTIEVYGLYKDLIRDLPPDSNELKHV